MIDRLPEKQVPEQAEVSERASRTSDQIVTAFHEKGYEAGKAALQRFWVDYKDSIASNRELVYLVLSDVLHEIGEDFDLHQKGDEVTPGMRYPRLREMKDFQELFYSFYEAIELSDQEQGYPQDLLNRGDRGELGIALMALEVIIADAEKDRLRNLFTRVLGRIRRRN